jgi:hypothetical protein
MDIPGYEIGAPLGSGGFGTVYRARQLSVRREVALKIDSRALTTDRDRRRFMREVTAAGRLSGHPHVVAVYDAGVLADGRPYMVLELCPGGSLNDRLHGRGPFPAAEVRDIGVRIADALAAAHGAGVLHRDVKPGNILLDRYGNVALADFGLAAMPAPGMESSATRESLTPAYAPPEAFAMSEPTAAGDIYSLGASLYALLSGRAPHSPPDRQLSIAELMAAHRQPVLHLPGVPSTLVAELRRAMAYDPADRPPTAAALRDALAAIPLLAESPSAAHAAGVYGAPMPPVAAPPAAAAPTTAPPADSPATVPPAMASPATVPPAAVSPATVPPAMASPAAVPPAAWPPGSAPPAATPAPANRRLVLGAAAVVAAGLVGAAALLAIPRLTGTETAGGAQPSPGPAAAGGARPGATQSNGAQSNGAQGTAARYGVPTVSTGCPAATVTGGQAACTRTAECWGGIVSIAGDTRATRYDCRNKHTWETFAIAIMPRDGETWNLTELSRHPVVRKVCSRTVLLGSRRGAGLRPAQSRWDIEVLPPTQSAFGQGDRVYRCLATLGLDGLRGSSFRPIG